MAKYVGYKRPKDTKKTMKHFLTYLGHYKWAIFPCGNSCIYQCGGRNLRHISDQTARQQFH